MRAAALLVVYALLLTTVAATWLRRARWVDRGPWLAIVAWQALSASAVLAVVLAGLALAMPAMRWSINLAELLEACQTALRAQYATPGGALASASGLVLAAVVTGRSGFSVLAELTNAWRARRRQRDMLALVAYRDERFGALVIDHDVAAAYCLPGRGRQVVLTSAALTALDDAELAGVLAHERAHLRGRHHLVLAAATGLERAFPIPMFRHAREEITRLIEMLADDAASRHCHRHTMATALVRLAHGTAPTAGLAAGGPTAFARVRRLLAPAAPLGPIPIAIGTLAAATALFMPFAVAAAPAIEALRMSYCPVGVPGDMTWLL